MQNDITSAQSSDLTNVVEDVTIDRKSTEGIGDQDETEWINSRWSLQWGYFNSIADLKTAVLMKAVWNVGKGYECDAETKVILDHVKGWGKDTFDDIIFNMEVVKRVGGDSYAEIIRADDGTLLNLKTLDPASIKHIVDRKGMILRYEQINKLSKKGETLHKFKPEQMFHLSHNRIADQIHGISDIDALEPIILADNESFTDNKQIMHHQARPIIVFKLGTDDPVKIAAFAAKMDSAVNKGENIYVPNDKDTFDFEIVQVNVSQLVLEWQTNLKNKFYRGIGLPQIVFGSSGATESGSKIEYLAHEQVFEKDQRYLEKQIWNQLGLKINLIPPVSLLENLQTDQSKDAGQGMMMQPNDVTAGSGQ